MSHAAAGVENTLALYLSLLGTPPGSAPPDDAKRQRYLDTMDTQRRRLSALFNAVFAYLPSNAGGDPAADLEATFQHAAVLAGTLGNDRGVSLQIEATVAPAAPLQIHRECVRQAILDGLLLAVEHAPSGAAVTACLLAEGNTARLGIHAPSPPDPAAALPPEFADCQGDLRKIGGNARWDVGDELHIELELPCSPAELP